MQNSPALNQRKGLSNSSAQQFILKSPLFLYFIIWIILAYTNNQASLQQNWEEKLFVFQACSHSLFFPYCHPYFIYLNQPSWSLLIPKGEVIEETPTDLVSWINYTPKVYPEYLRFCHHMKIYGLCSTTEIKTLPVIWKGFNSSILKFSYFKLSVTKIRWKVKEIL